MTTTDTTASTMQIGQRLVDLCREGRNRQAIEELYADDAVSIEPMAGPNGSRETRGKEALLAASDWFFNACEIHDATIQGPYPMDDKFICRMTIDLTGRESSPFAGQRMQMEEGCLYTVRSGRIVKSEFFYNPDKGGDCGG